MAGDFDFFTDEPAARPTPKTEPPARRTPAARPTDPPADDPPRYRARAEAVPTKKLSPLVLVAIVVGGLIVLGVGVTGIILALGNGSKKTEPKSITSTTTGATPRPPVSTPKKDPAGDLTTPSPEVVEKVKRATVKVLVQFAGKRGGGSGSGFVEKDSRMVLTNAHVVGMKSIDDPEPLINLVVNSGRGEEEYRLDGEVIAVDGENDLAIIRPTLLQVGKRTPVPDGLVVPRTSTVKDLDRLFVFGFPLGSALGAEISVRPTQVTSLRHEGGKLKKIQVEGGMTFGNSGGPVVDVRGNVIGVAVSGIKDANINFCVPGEIVQQLLANRKAWKE